MRLYFLLLFFVLPFERAFAQYTLVPDANFEQELINLGIDSEGYLDGQLLTADAQSTMALNVSNKNISDLTGIEDFVNLSSLICNDNQLTSLDVSNLTSLTSLNCNNNQLTSLDLFSTWAIQVLRCANNNITSLDFSNNSALSVVVCSNNDISSLNVSSNPSLNSLYCSDNSLTSLNLANNPNLSVLYCNNNQINQDIATLLNTNMIEAYLQDNDLFGCYPSYVCSIYEFDSSNNPQLPWSGNYLNLCNGGTQVGAPCVAQSGSSSTIDGSCLCGICMISSSGISNEQCNDNGTPSDPSDDYITFDLDPQGSGLASTYSVTNATPVTGDYGVVTTFSTAPGTGGNGDIVITIIDDDDPNCLLTELVADQGTCSDACLISSSGLTNITCNDNGTPSDNTDDFITFDLDPVGSNTGSGYDVSGALEPPTSGTYGSTMTFNTIAGTAGGGDLNITIEDVDDPGCFLDEVVIDPGTCSDLCEMLLSGIGGDACNDNGTPSDPSDDFITFQLDPSGNNLGTTYTVTGSTFSPPGSMYGGVTIFSTLPGTAGGGDIDITIVDDDDTNCILMEKVFDDGTCSNACTISTVDLTNILCNDNGTPSDPSDDYITFDLNPSGVNVGNSYTVTGTTLNSASGPYGQVTTFSTLPGTAGAGDLNLTVADDGMPMCTFPFMVTDLGTCSNACNISTANLTNVLCNDNNTPSDPSDDYITFDLTPDGANVGSGYTLTGANVNPTTGLYGQTTTFSTLAGTAGAGDLNLTIVDDATATCTFPFMVTDPGTCSNACVLSSLNITNVQCNDNATPSDASDDYITFDLNPQGSGTGTTYTVTGATPATGTYGSASNYRTADGTAGAGNLNITVTDGGTPTCTFSEMVNDPGTCSNACALSSLNITNVQCNDNTTPSDASDDYITFDLNPQGSGTGTTYTVTGATPATGTYGSASNYRTADGTAGAGNLNITVTDDVTPTCTLSEMLNDPGSCSGACLLSSLNITNVQCNDNATPSDASDDYITFDLNPQGSGTGTTYTVTGATPATGTYGSVSNYRTADGTAGAGNLSITVTDGGTPTCTLSGMLNDPGSCSGSCSITNGNLTNVTCNDNNTPNDLSDDYITFDLNPQGSGLGGSYTIMGANVNPAAATYGQSTSFSTDFGTAGAGDLSLSIVDNSNSNCTLDFTLTDPGSCSNTCQLLLSGLTNVQCNDNGTLSDASDDFITFELNPTGNNLGSTYTLSGVALLVNNANYGSSTTFSTLPGSAGTGNLNITITDDTDASCQLMEVVFDPGTCSNSCMITAVNLSNIQCDNNGTDNDPDDDFLKFDLNPEGINIGVDYTLTGAVLDVNIWAYGSTKTFTTLPGSAGSGDLNLTLVDNSNSNCSSTFSVSDSGTCSGACQLSSSGLSNITCNDNSTTSDSSDDYFEFSLNPVGNNLGGTYTVSGGVTPTTGTYGIPTNFETMPGTAGAGNLNITITDDVTGTCSIAEEVIDPGTCSGVCNIVNAGLSSIECNDNGSTDDTDDYITFELNPQGAGIGTTYTLSGANITPNTGTYGDVATFRTDAGSAGSGDLNITITDDVDANCTFDFLLSDPGICSNCPTITANLSGSSSICEGDATDIVFNFNGGMAPYDVQYSDGTNTQSLTGIVDGASVPVSPITDATYTIVAATDANGCAVSVGTNAVITVNPIPTSDFTVTSPICVTESSMIEYTGSASLTANFNWDFDGGTTVSTANAGSYVIQWPSDGFANVTLIVEESGCTSLQSSQPIQIDAELEPIIISCDPANITNSSVGFIWNNDPNVTNYQIETSIDGAGFTPAGDQTNTDFSVSNITGGNNTDVEIRITATGNTVCGPTQATLVCQTSNCPPDISNINDQLCPDEFIIVNGTRYDQSNPQGSEMMQNVLDCDSIINIDLGFYLSYNETATGAFCPGGSYVLPDGRTVNTTGDFTSNLQSVNGCDSIITTTISMSPPIMGVTEFAVICEGGTFDWNGQAYTTPDTYTFNTQTIDGCDSTAVLELSAEGVSTLGSADAGQDREECNDEVDLFGIDLPNTTGVWQSLDGATVQPADQAAAVASGLQNGENRFVWSLSSTNCNDFDRDTVRIELLGERPVLGRDVYTFRNEFILQLPVLNNDDLKGFEEFTFECTNVPPEVASWSFDQDTRRLMVTLEPLTSGGVTFDYTICPISCPDFCETQTVVISIENGLNKGGEYNIIITPNNDGANDNFVIPDLNEENNIYLYNRWGSVVFTATPYVNGSWDGENLPDGTYYFVARNLPDQIWYGSVVIIRGE